MSNNAKDIRVVSYNCARNYLYLDVLLSTWNNVFDVVFIQEPPWQTLRTAPSTVNREGDDVVGAPRHPEWMTIVRPPDPGPDSRPRVLAYVSIGSCVCVRLCVVIL